MSGYDISLSSRSTTALRSRRKKFGPDDPTVIRLRYPPHTLNAGFGPYTIGACLATDDMLEVQNVADRACGGSGTPNANIPLPERMRL